MKKRLLSATAIVAISILSASSAMACSDTSARSVLDQLKAGKVVGEPVFLSKTSMLGELEDGTIIASQDSNKYIFVNPMVIDVTTGSKVNIQSLLHPDSNPNQVNVLRNKTNHAKTNGSNDTGKSNEKITSPNLKSLLLLDNVKGQLFNKKNQQQSILTVFVDPLCPSCHQFMSNIRYAGLPDDIAINIIPVSVISASVEHQKAPHVLASTDPDLMGIMLSKKFPNNPTQESLAQANTNRDAYRSFKMTFVPAFVLPDGTTIDRFENLESMIETIRTHTINLKK